MDLSLNSTEYYSYDNCVELKIIGFYMLIIFICSTYFNFSSILVFYRSKLFTPINFFMVTLLSLNLLATFIESPFMIYKSYKCRYAYCILEFIHYYNFEY